MRNGAPVVVTNSSGNFTIPNHMRVVNPITGGLHDLLITDFRNTSINYTCTAGSSDIFSSIVVKSVGMLLHV